jgi:hypothetical protein
VGRVGIEHLAIFGMQVARDHRRMLPGDADRHHHGLGRAGRAVIHRGIRQVHAGEFRDHRLELEDGLQRALRKLGLVGRVGGQEFAALHQRVDDHGPVMEVGPGSEKTGVAFAVFFGALLEPVDDFRLGHLPRDGEIARQTVLGGNRREKFVHGADADRLQHGGAIRGRFRQISHRNL